MKHNILSNEIYLLKYSDKILIGYVDQSILGSHDVCISILIFSDFGHLNMHKYYHILLTTKIWYNRILILLPEISNYPL